MTNPAALDRAVREVTTPLDRLQFVDRGWVFPRRMFADHIRARYRKIVAMADKPLT